MKLGSLFDGAGTCPLAATICGIEPVWASEIEAFPIAVTTKRFPNMKHLGDITKIKGDEIEPVDIITFGSPCFPAGTLVNTKRGLIPIEQVKITDKVFTHKGRYRQVLNAQYTGTKKLLRLHAMGVNHIDATPNHLFYVKEDKNAEPVWKLLSELQPKNYIGSPLNTELENPLNLTEEESYLLGRYIADGYLRKGQRPNRPQGSMFSTVVFCIGHGKEAQFEDRIKTLKFGKSKTTKNVTKYTISDHRLFHLCEECGVLAENKQFPQFLIDTDVNLLMAAFNGYMDGDGSFLPIGIYSITTISEKLAYTFASVVEKLFRVSSRVYFYKSKETTVIEGRTVSQQPQWTVRFKLDANPKDRGFYDDGYVWYPIRYIEPLEEKKAVYDLTVAEDHSFCVYNIAVHNCQDLSMAGKREGLDGERSGLFMEAVRIIKEMRKKTDGRYPRYAMWENVCGAFSSNNGEDFRVVLEELCRVKESSANVPRPDWGGNQMLNLFGEMQDPLWETTTPSHGGSLMHNFGESPKDVEESTLSQILTEEVPQKYYLSETACRGVLRRKEKHGKALPPLLHIALLINAKMTTTEILEELKKSSELKIIHRTQDSKKQEMSSMEYIVPVEHAGATSL